MSGTMSWNHALRVALVLALLGVAAFPIYWMLVTSLTSSPDLFAAKPHLLPDFALSAVYLHTFSTTAVATWLKNSAIVAFGTAGLSIVLAIFPAYVLSRYRMRAVAILGVALFVTQMLPEAMLVVPLYAGIDGCSRLGIVLSVVLPLVAPSLAAAAVIAFFHGWNEYVFAQTLISDQGLQTASVGLAGFVGELSTPMHTVMAIGLMYTLPAVVFYLFVQRYVVSGMTAGSVKG